MGGVGQPRPLGRRWRLRGHRWADGDPRPLQTRSLLPVRRCPRLERLVPSLPARRGPVPLISAADPLYHTAAGHK